MEILVWVSLGLYEEVRKPQQQILDCERIRDMRIQC